MNIKSILSPFEEPTKDDSIEYNIGEDYNSTIRSFQGKDGYGVYLFLKDPEISYENILYIGMSGKINQDGCMSGQKIKKRLTMKQEGRMRRYVTRRKMKKEKIPTLYIRYFLTLDITTKKDKLPVFIESSLLQDYYENKNSKLPPWNKSI